MHTLETRVDSVEHQHPLCIAHKYIPEPSFSYILQTLPNKHIVMGFHYKSGGRKFVKHPNIRLQETITKSKLNTQRSKCILKVIVLHCAFFLLLKGTHNTDSKEVKPHVNPVTTSITFWLPTYSVQLKMHMLGTVRKSRVQIL